MKTILITGAKGFIGKNTVVELERAKETYTLLTYDQENTKEQLKEYMAKADFIIHLAGINRPKNETEFETGNKGFTEELIDIMETSSHNIPLLITSSIQAEKDNAYGKSKKAAEEAIFTWASKTKTPVYVYRLPNVFGKWCRPNYNSVVATFMHNIARDLPIQVNDENYELTLVYIDDIMEEFKQALMGKANRKEDGYCYIPVTHKIRLGELADTIRSFKVSRRDLTIPTMTNQLTKKLYSTYLSYLPEDQFSYPLKMNQDHRGSFTEFLKSTDRGQVSVNISKPNITKGNHWHHTKNEKFLVVSGEGVIRFRNPFEETIIEYQVSGDQLEVVDIPTGYTHNIENLGDTDLVTIMWVNEIFDPEKPDTYFLEV